MFELTSLKLLHYQLFFSHLSTENISSLLHLLLCLCNGPECVIFVFSEESTVRTKSLSVSQTYDFKIFVMQTAFLSFLRWFYCRLSHFLWRSFRQLRNNRMFPFLHNLGKWYILGKILQVSFLKIFLMPTMLANQDIHLCLYQ